MKKKQMLFLLIGLGICSAINLVDRFIVAIPDPLAIVLLLAGSISLVYSMILFRRSQKG